MDETEFGFELYGDQPLRRRALTAGWFEVLEVLAAEPLAQCLKALKIMFALDVPCDFDDGLNTSIKGLATNGQR